MAGAVISQALAAILAVESGGKPDAVGDGGKAVGAYQIWPIAVHEANRIAGRKLWTVDDRRNPQLSRAMARVTLEHHYRRGVTDPVDLACRWRNPKGDAPAWHRRKIERAIGRTKK